MTDIVVIGAGVSGLVAANALRRAGRAVLVLEKSRGLGGRAATRRRDGAFCDHGAPKVTPDGPADFCNRIGEWLRAGRLARWPGGGPSALVPPDGMSRLLTPLTDGLEIAFERQAAGLSRTAEGWEIALSAGETIAASTVLLAIPCPQARVLIGKDGRLAPETEPVTMRPQWTVMVRFPEATTRRASSVKNIGGALAYALCDSTKPGRAAGPETWVLHARHDWTEANLDLERDAVGAILLREFTEANGVRLPEPDMLMVHRWRYARTGRPLGRPCLWDPAARLGLAGDWCLGANIGDAWESGTALAAAVLAH